MRQLAFAVVVLLSLPGLLAWADEDPAAPSPDAPVEQAPVEPEVVVEEPPVVETAPPAEPTPTAGPSAPQPPVGPTAARTTPLPPPTAPLSTAVLDIRKTHNLPWRCSCTALRLDVDFLLVGQKDRFVGARVDFYAQNGKPIQSVLYPFANERGQVSAWTHLVRQTQDVARMHTALMIPYRAFPCACQGDHYEVTARVLLLRREGRAQNTELARGETTFTVWSGPETTPAEVGVERETPRDSGGDASLEPYDEYRPQDPLGAWADPSEVDAWGERPPEGAPRAAQERGTSTQPSTRTGSRSGPAPMPQPSPSSTPLPEPSPSR